MKFEAEELRDIITSTTYTLLDGTQTTRVSEEESSGKHDCTHVHVVFQHDVDNETKFYEFGYERSYQEGIQSYYWDDAPDCSEVEPYEVTITRYRRV